MRMVENQPRQPAAGKEQPDTEGCRDKQPTNTATADSPATIEPSPSRRKIRRPGNAAEVTEIRLETDGFGFCERVSNLFGNAQYQ